MRRQATILLDDLGSAGEDRGRYGQAELSGGIEVDDQLGCGRLLDWQIDRLGPVEDLSDVDTDFAKGGREACSITDQAAGSGVLTRLIDRRDSMA